MLTPNTELHMGYSRLVLLAREGVQLSLMNDCMADNIPAIWVKLASKGTKSLMIGGIYREFHHILQPAPNNTDNWDAQISRWKTTVAGWKRTSRNSKCIILGDLNIDYLRWSDRDYRLKRLAQIVKDELETIGFCQLIDKITRSWPGQQSSAVDQIWTNSPNNIMSTSNKVRSSSDHHVISAVVRTKDRMEHCHDITRRDRKNFNIDRYRLKIQNIDWTALMESNDIDHINDIFVDKVGTILEEEAPLRHFQSRKNFKNWLTPELKSQMESRDMKRELARQTNDNSHSMDYRREKNKCSKNLKNVRNKHYNDIFENFDKAHDTKNIYNTTINLLGWKKGGPPPEFPD